MEITMENVAKMAGLKPVKEFEYLGYANGWQYSGGTPAIVEKCYELGHPISGKTIGNCLTERCCEICGYYYNVDSSG